MPNPKQHQEKADDNRTFLASIDVNQFPGWAATVAFYVSVHLVEKLRAYDGGHSTNHADRAQFVRRRCACINTDYSHLYDASLEARYKSRHAFTLSPQEVQDRLINTHLVAIETYVAAQTAARTSGGTGS